jgi:homoserine O-acetyltransferase
MKLLRLAGVAATALLLSLCSLSTRAADYPPPQQGNWVARDFRFHTGEVMPELRLHYTTIGSPSGEPVLILHGTTASGASMLTPAFAGELFGPGQPLDAAKYFIILPDSIGAGASSKPSDGLRAKFPKYDYDDMVAAHYRLVTEGLGLRHLRLVLGYSMGGMQTWLWGTKYPDFMDALVPMASQPTEMAGRNWMTRRLLVEMIRRDPEWNGGNYSSPPRILKTANALFGLTTTGGSLAYYLAAPTRAKADKLVEDRLAAPMTTDANDFIYQWESADDFNASPALERIRAPLLAINSADDERNPPELGIMERELARVKGGRLLLIPTSAETRGHGTTVIAKLWKSSLKDLLQDAPRRSP